MCEKIESIKTVSLNSNSCITYEFCFSDDLEALNACNFVLAKQMWSNLRKNPLKHLNYWLQGYLAKATNLYFAYKDQSGIVHEPIVHKRLSDLPKEYVC